MLVRPYKDTDYPDLVKWYQTWNEACPPQDMLPANGFIIPEICAGFLYLTDSKLGIIDCYISNPEVSPIVKNKFLNVLTVEILACAKQKGCRALMATTKINAIKKRSELHGFKYIQETSVYMREI